MRRVSVLHPPGDPVASPLSPHVQQSLLAALERIDELFTRTHVAILTPPVPGSAAAAELADKSQAYAYNVAATAIQNAIDHLRAWRQPLRTGLMPMYAHMSLVRTAYESALVAYWLLEPGIDADTRHARGFGARFDDYEEKRRFEQSIAMTTPPAEGKLAVDRLGDLMNAADELGFTKLDKNGKRVLRIRVPGTVELFDQYEPVAAPAKGQWRYRLYSGYAHAMSWTLTLGAEQMAPFDAAGQTIALAQTPDSMTVDATQGCVAALERAIGAYEQLRK
jgi:hypothetical protein